VSRALVIPAAGAGTRLGSRVPKLLAPVLGRPMLEHLLDLYADRVDRVVLVVAPSARAVVASEWRRLARPLPLELAEQTEPTGMLDAVGIAAQRLRERPPERVWITWCDQVAVLPETVAELARIEARSPEAALVLPTAKRRDPYVHLVRAPGGEISAVLHRREGDLLPEEGESDVGLFGLSAFAALDLLPRFAREAPRGRSSGERNFLELLPWLSRRARVESFPARHETESVGINTPDDLVRVEAFLRGA